MAFSYAFALFMFFGGLFGAGNDLLDYVPADAYWNLKALPMTFERMADEVRVADPEAAVNLVHVFETATGDDRDRLALALIDQGESARGELIRLSRSPEAGLAARANACIEAIDKAPKERPIRRLMAIRTLGALGRKEAIPLLQPLLKSSEPFVAAYATEAIASLEGRQAPIRPLSRAIKDDIWRLPAECRAVGQIAPRVVGPELADRVLAGMNMPPGMERAEAIDGLTFTLVKIADQFGNMRFEGITLAVSADLGEKTGYVLALLRGHYDHATINVVLSNDRTPFNEFADGRIYLPGGMAIYAPSDDLLIFAASPSGLPPVQPVITAARSLSSTRPTTTRTETERESEVPSTNPISSAQDADPRLDVSADMDRLIASVDTTQPVWLAAKNGEEWRKLPPLAGLDTLKISGGRDRNAPLNLYLQAKLTDATAARDAAAAVTALLPATRPAAATQAGMPEGKAPFSPLLTTISAALAGKEVTTDGDRVSATATLTLTRSDVMRLLLTSMDTSRVHKASN